MLKHGTWQDARYQKLMDGCAKMYTERECYVTEVQRLKMSMDQPKSQHNYTELGFKKLKLPQHVWELLSKFYEMNKAHAKEEKWSRGYTYVNHWESPSYMVSVEDASLFGGGAKLKQEVWDGVKPIIEEWVGREIVPTSQYGIRIYTNNSVLATHVDRTPLISSCIINVAQEGMAEPWPIEVYSHDGKAYNVTMEPGDMVLYESATVLHGRPAPLNGKAYANIFVHFEPVDHHRMNELDRQKPARLRSRQMSAKDLLDSSYDSPLHSELYKDVPSDKKLHVAASKGHIHTVQKLLEQDINQIHHKDDNGWQAIHEAVRSGHTEVVRYLIDHGADMAATTNTGGSPLWWAKRRLPAGHSVIRYLEEIGAPELGEEL
jgi:prolyl 4-hydroxylase